MNTQETIFLAFCVYQSQEIGLSVEICCYDIYREFIGDGSFKNILFLVRKFKRRKVMTD